MVWDLLKQHHENNKRDKTSVVAILHSLDDNRAVCQENIKALRSELGYLENYKPVTEPLLTLDDGLWQLLRLQLPHRVATTPDLLRGIGYLFQRINGINRQIAARETYRHTNAEHDDFMNHMARFDNALVADFESLWESLLEYEHQLFENQSLRQRLLHFVRHVLGLGVER